MCDQSADAAHDKAPMKYCHAEISREFPARLMGSDMVHRHHPNEADH